LKKEKEKKTHTSTLSAGHPDNPIIDPSLRWDLAVVV